LLQNTIIFHKVGKDKNSNAEKQEKNIYIIITFGA